MTDCKFSGYSPDTSGHSQIRRDGKLQPHHKYLWEKVYGPIVGDYVLHHTCQQGRCVNLNHLVLMSREEHSRFHGRGENNANSILSEENVREIKRLWKTERENWTYRKLMAKFPGVGKGAINSIVNGRTWKHLDTCGGSIKWQETK